MKLLLYIVLLSLFSAFVSAETTTGPGLFNISTFSYNSINNITIRVNSSNSYCNETNYTVGNCGFSSTYFNDSGIYFQERAHDSDNTTFSYSGLIGANLYHHINMTSIYDVIEVNISLVGYGVSPLVELPTDCVNESIIQIRLQQWTNGGQGAIAVRCFNNTADTWTGFVYHSGNANLRDRIYDYNIYYNYYYNRTYSIYQNNTHVSTITNSGAAFDYITLNNTISQRMSDQTTTSHVNNNITINFSSVNLSNVTFEVFFFNTSNVSIDNCSNYDEPVLNYTYYRYPYTELGNVDSVVNFTCNRGSIYYFNVSVDYDTVNGSQMCHSYSNINTECDVINDYVADWTYGYIYRQTITNTDFNSTYTHSYNLTIPMLFLNFSSTTDVIIGNGSDTDFQYNDTDILIAMTELPEGRVQVQFNNMSQYFEFENDVNDNTNFFDRDLFVMTGDLEYMDLRVEDVAGQLLPEATVEIWEVDWFNRETRLVHHLYGEGERTIQLDPNERYKAIATATDYQMQNNYKIFTVGEFTDSSMVLVMEYNETADIYSIYTNSNLGLAFNNYSTMDIDVYIVSNNEMQQAYIEWYLNDTLVDTDTMSGSGRIFTGSYVFPTGYSNLTSLVYIDGELEERFIFREYEQENYFDRDSYLEDIRTSKLAFFIFLLFIIGSAAAIQHKVKDYGMHTLVSLSFIFSFFNYFLIIITIIGIIGLFGKKVSGDES